MVVKFQVCQSLTVEFFDKMVEKSEKRLVVAHFTSNAHKCARCECRSPQLSLCSMHKIRKILMKFKKKLAF